MNFNLEILPEPEKDEQIKKNMGCIVFVHGICHGAWCWKHFIDFFSDHGYQCYAVSLRGHGNSEGHEQLQTFRLSDYVDDVKATIELCTSRFKMKPFLIGHSMGGAVVQQYIGKYADTIQGAVLFAPATAPKMTRWGTLPKNLNLIFATLIALGYNSKLITHHAAFFTGKDNCGRKIQRIKDASPYYHLLQAESKEIIGGIIKKGDLIKTNYTENHKPDIPIFVIGSFADAYFPQKSLEKTATIYAGNGKTALKILDCLCHDMMLDPDWVESAKPILKFIENPLKFVADQENHWPRKQK